MAENFILSENRNTYGGLIFASDFCTDYEGTRNIAKRIATDMKFDEYCKKATENYRKNKQNAK